jgi:HD-like signal output (HDOD) protein
MPTILPDLKSNKNTVSHGINCTDSSKNSKIRDRLLEKFSTDIDLLSLGIAIARVVELASSEDEATQNLAYYILSDVALTQKILRLANTVFYRTVSNTPVTTISRAIFLLGFDTVKTSALALLLVDNLSKGQHAESIRLELVESLCASLVGRELGRYSHMQGAEEASIAALFKNLGRLLIASHEHPLYRDVESLCATGSSQTQASIQVMGCSYDFLTETVLREWNIPDPLIHALNPLPSGPLKPSKTRLEWMRQVVAFSAEADRIILHTKEPASSPAARALLARFGVALHLDQDKMRLLFATVSKEIGQVVNSLNLALQTSHRNAAPAECPTSAERLPSVLQLAAMNTYSAHTDARHASGKPINARDLLLAGIQVATQMMGGGHYKPSELILLITETLYSSLGFRFAALCIHDTKNSQYRAIVSIGEQHTTRQGRFVFTDVSDNDVFHLSIDNNADLMIAETNGPTIRSLLPAWHRALLPDARSIMLLPLVNDQTPLGLFYADRVRPAPEGVSSDETALIKTLIGQMMTAVSAR